MGISQICPHPKTNINRRYPQIITMQSCNPSADPGQSRACWPIFWSTFCANLMVCFFLLCFCRLFLSFFSLEPWSLGLTNCTVSTSMSICKRFHHHWKFRRYPVFRLLAKQKGSSSANLIDCSEENRGIGKRTFSDIGGILVAHC